MSSPEFTLLHIIHVASALMLVGFTFFAFAADPSRRKMTLMWSGIASLLVLLTGFRMWQGTFAFAVAGWIFVKIACWLIISALAGIGFRRRGSAGALIIVTLVAGATAIAMAYAKPF
jgi:hypothetical protein